MCVALYNQYMGGVDVGDQLQGYYHVCLKCTKNYKYIFLVLGQCVHHECLHPLFI